MDQADGQRKGVSGPDYIRENCSPLLPLGLSLGPSPCTGGRMETIHWGRGVWSIGCMSPLDLDVSAINKQVMEIETCSSGDLSAV